MPEYLPLAADRAVTHHAAVYELRPPAPVLRRFIETYWFVASTPRDPVDLTVDVFVDGRADLIFNFEGPYQRATVGGETREVHTSNLDAQRLSPIRISQRGLVRTTGVRFRLGGLGPFARLSLNTITNRIEAPERVFGPDAGPLEASLRLAPNPDAAAGVLDAFFLSRLATTRSYEVFERILKRSVESRGLASVEDLSASARVSTRHVDRLFARYLGVPPKTLAKILRFQCALETLMRDPGCTLADVASAAGYFDQAHFIKDFRRFSGGLPRGYRGHYPPESPTDFAPNVVVFVQDTVPYPTR